jgi:hypothetical protein
MIPRSNIFFVFPIRQNRTKPPDHCDRRLIVALATSWSVNAPEVDGEQNEKSGPQKCVALHQTQTSCEPCAGRCEQRI